MTLLVPFSSLGPGLEDLKQAPAIIRGVVGALRVHGLCFTRHEENTWFRTDVVNVHLPTVPVTSDF